MKKHIRIAVFIGALILFVFDLSFAEKLYYAAPTLLPYTQREMKTAGFWVGRHPFPDDDVLTPDEAKDFNRRLREELQLIKDVTTLPSEYSGEKFGKGLEESLSAFSQKGFYLANDKKAAPDFFKKTKAALNLEALGPVGKRQFGFIVRFADERFLPTREGLFEKQGDIDFDELQNSDLDIGTAVAILHQSLDGKWYYVEDDLTEGWVEAAKVAFGNLEEVKNFLTSNPFVVVTSAKADIFLNAELTEYHDHVRMGVKFPLLSSGDPLSVKVRIPLRDQFGFLVFKDAYLKKEDVREGYLSYTPRHIIEQAFKLLNAPYGWGGMYGEQDCSRFLQEIFATVGISLPRNSKEQAQAGRLLAKFDEKTSPEERLRVLKNEAVSAIALLPMKGHIMLYLGVVDERAYAIHATWGYREKGLSDDQIRVINRVTVSDLSLGEETKKASWLERLTGIVLIGK